MICTILKSFACTHCMISSFLHCFLACCLKTNDDQSMTALSFQTTAAKSFVNRQTNRILQFNEQQMMFRYGNVKCCLLGLIDRIHLHQPDIINVYTTGSFWPPFYQFCRYITLTFMNYDCNSYTSHPELWPSDRAWSDIPSRWWWHNLPTLPCLIEVGTTAVFHHSFSDCAGSTLWCSMACIYLSYKYS